MIKLKNNLKAVRKSLGLTQAVLAEQIGVSRKTINTIENRVYVPSTILALQIAEALNTNIHEIFQLEKNSSS